MAPKNVSRGQLKAKLTEALIRASQDVGKEPDHRDDFERQFCFAVLLRYATPNQR